MIRRKQEHKPEILAPAGNMESFFAAIAAGADAIYCSLKNFSARMEADNFSIEELSKLSQLARKKDVKLYLAINSVLKDSEIPKVGRMLVRVKRYVKPDALIINDPAIIAIANEVGIRSELHLSTLSALSLPSGLKIAQKNKISRVVLPREFSIDQIKLMADKKSGVDLEVFIHGSLCYAISGRCYWSSFMGGRSGLRGRCVQPCRRLYSQGSDKNSFFSCMDLGIDVLVKVLQEVPAVKTWKIEGRKKTPHYVYYTVWGYKSLRDQPMTAKEKKDAVKIFDEALGRPMTHYNFLPQRPYNPAGEKSETGSGKFLGRISRDSNSFFLNPREPLLRGDKVRVGYEGDAFHSVIYIPLSLPKGGKFVFRASDFKKIPPSKTPVFLIDRKEEELIKAINSLKAEYDEIEVSKTSPVSFSMPGKPVKKDKRKIYPKETFVKRCSKKGNLSIPGGFWIDEQFIENLPLNKKPFSPGQWFWIPPFIWPEKEQIYIDAIDLIIEKGGRNFVANGLWQAGLFKKIRDLNVWGGPFSNLTNTLAAEVMLKNGFKGAIVSPELSKEEFLSMPLNSNLPLGIITKGYFPYAISAVKADELKVEDLFFSPKKEGGFARKYDSLYWIYPSWEIDLTEFKTQLKKAGYSLFVEIKEDVPKEVLSERRKSSKLNWDLNLL
ncbi:MAG: U32 family peptidase [Desulforegulaceae bacterium]|nr:U32 family peptidase [Desulforegulaceae bacterium]